MNRSSNDEGDGKTTVDPIRESEKAAAAAALEAETEANKNGAGTTEEASTQPKKRSVRFDPSTSAPAGDKPTKKRPPRMHPDAIPKHLSPTKFGKANPVRDLSVFVGFILFVMYVTYDFGNPEPANKSSLIETMEMAAENVNQMHDALTRMAARQFEKSHTNRPDVPCAVFASPSTISGAGLGLFAGRDYDAGEAIPVISDGLQGSASAAWLLPIPVTTGGVGSDARSLLWAPAHALLLKHHPVLANVNGTLFVVPEMHSQRPDDKTAAFELTATRPILAGTELFARLEAHPHGYLLQSQSKENEQGWRQPSSDASLSRPFSRIPTPGDYELADQIWDDADLAVRKMRAVHRLAQVHCGTWFGTLQGTVARIRPTVGSLLAATQPPHERGNQTTALASLKNQTVLQLRVKGSCAVDDVVYIAPSSAADSPRAVAGRSVKKGALLTRIPLYAVPAGLDRTRLCSSTDRDAEHERERECSFDDGPFRHPLGVSAASSSVALYPLAHAGLVLAASNSEGKIGVDVNVNDEKDGGSSDGSGNLEVQWADVAWSLHPDRSSLRDIWDAPPGSLMWNVVATADLRQGDELVLRSSNMASLFPDHWKLSGGGV